MKMTSRCTSTLLMLAALAMLTLPAIANDQVMDVKAEGSMLIFTPLMEYESIELVVTGPKRTLTRNIYANGKQFAWDVFDQSGKARPDGPYTFQLRVTPIIDAEAKEMLQAARFKGNEDETFVQLCEEGRIPDGPITQNGYFLIIKSELVMGGETEKTAAEQRQARSEDADKGLEVSPEADFVINDDLIVDGSACIGFDCVNGESFGFDTIRLKENNLRIKFEDTSVAASFPTTDWQLTANASANGGASKFSIDDISGGRTPFTVEANAPSHSLYVDDGGRIGNGTSTPSVEIHTVDGDTPTLRLQQDGSSGFAPQTWDVAGNETNFFIRDVTNGSTLPFRIRPGASTSAIFIDVDSDIGFGTASPDEDLHIVRSAVPIGVKLENSADNRNWTFKMSGSGFAVNEDAEASTLLLRDSGEMRVGNDGAEEFVVRSNGDTEIDGNLDVDGDITATGTISDRDRKQQIVNVDGADVLSKVLALPVSTWVYNHQTEVRHIGPMAQDFHAAFGLGTERSIGLTDLGGLSLAAIQELHQQFESQLENKDAELEQLRTESAEMQQRLEALEAALLALQQN